MGEVKKIGDEYFIEFFARGLKYQQKIGRQKEKAEAALREVEEKIAKGEASVVVRDVDYDIFFADFLDSITHQHTPKTRVRFEALIRHFTQFLTHHHPTIKMVSHITPRTIELYKAHLNEELAARGKFNQNLVNLSLILLREVFQYSIKLGYLNDNPTLHIRLSPIPKKKLFFLIDELRKIIQPWPPELKVVLDFILMTGLRPSEIFELQWKDIQFIHHQIVVPSRQPDPDGLFFIPMTPQMNSFLKNLKGEAQPEDFVFQSDSQKSQVKDLIKALDGQKKGQRLNLLHFRQAFAIHLVQKGLSLPQLYKILGENDLARTLNFSGWIPLLF